MKGLAHTIYKSHQIINISWVLFVCFERGAREARILHRPLVSVQYNFLEIKNLLWRLIIVGPGVESILSTSHVNIQSSVACWTRMEKCMPDVD